MTIPGHNASILLVDDRPEDLLALEAVLADLGHRLVRAPSGEEALRRLAEHHFAVILLDVRMPGMDGYETAARVRASEDAPATPILFLTAGDAAPGDVRRAYALGAVDFLSKPIVAELLRAKVANLVHLWTETQAVHEEALRGREEELRLIIDAVPALISYVDTEGRYRLANRAYEVWFGLDSGAICGRHLRDVLGEATWEVIRPRVEAALAGQRVAFEDVLPYSSGSRWVGASYTPHFDRRGRVAGMVALVHDLTQRRQTEEGVRRLMAHARCLLWHAVVTAPEVPSGAYRWDLQFFAEEAAREFLRLDPAPGEPLPVAFYRSKPPDDREMIDRNAREAFESGARHYRQEYRSVDRDGRLRWLSEETHLDPIAPGRWRAVGVCTEVTEQKQLEATLRQRADELAAAHRHKDEFMAVVGHELRSPLAAMANGLHLIRRQGQDLPAIQQTCAMLERQLKQVARLVGDLQDVTRLQRGALLLQKERTDLGRIAAESVETCRPLVEERGHTLVVVLPETPLWVEADPERLVQVLCNLLVNAAKYTDPGGRVGLTARREGNHAVVRVSDSGIGVAAEDLPHLFELFGRADSRGRAEEGLGIGLALVRGLLEMHDGQVEARSDGPGQGSEFVVRLPIAPQRRTRAGRGRSLAAPPADGPDRG
jgi:PAS domain S-box-containing protein